MHWLLLLLPLLLPAALYSAGHALLNKRDPRSALGWIVLCLTVPGAGAVFYWLFGVNRIRTRARRWQTRGRGMPWLKPGECDWDLDPSLAHPYWEENVASLLTLSDAVTRRPLLPGNRLDLLHNGEAAYPAMLAAIDGARQSICLSSYIFDNDATGRRFAAALIAAAERGVAVRVLLDALGEYYSWPPAHRLFADSPVQAARFLPLSLTERGIHINLRNHRKLLVIDGLLGFTGGMNIGDRHLAANGNPHRVVDLHFRVGGPVVGQMHEAFLEDWQFTTGEEVAPPPSYPPPVADGYAFCRGISAGPNEDFEKLVWIVIGALNCARRKVRIMTPYFIPDRALLAAINAAVLRGVTVELVLPAHNNLPLLHWAARSFLWELLEFNCHVYYQPGPFVHSKLLLVDDEFALVGSANLDQRSLRLNFEFNLEVYDRALVERLATHFDTVRAGSRALTPAELDARPLPVKLRDNLAKLLAPYL